MKKFNTLLLLALCFAISSMQAQTRYLDEIATEVTVTENVVYGQNISVLTMGLQELTMDIYMPAGDDATDRAVVIHFHAGSFLPQYFNGQIIGGKKDSAAVEICTRLAKMGYVAVSATYRLGWLPLADDQNVRTSTLLQAAYRGILDARTCARFLRKSAAEGNPYGIDPNKVTAWGQGTGGFIAYGAAFLDRYEEVVIDKFINTVTLLPYIDTLIHGNVYGTNLAELNIPNHVGYSSDFQMAVNMGGALGDLSWIEGPDSPAPEPTTVGFHVPSDPFTPFGNGPVRVTTTGEFVVNVSGTRTATERANELGTNDVLAPVAQWPNALNAYVDSLAPVPFQFPGQEPTTLATAHMYPFITPDFRVESAPWSWWGQAQLDAEIAFINANLGTNFDSDLLHNNGLLTNPDMSAEKGRAYIDTIMMYVAPRACATFGFQECLDALGIVSVKEILDDNAVGLNLWPNPASETVYLQTDAEFPIKDIRIIDSRGLLLKSYLNIKENQFALNRGNLPPGMYIALLHFDEGTVARRIIFR
jgi:hypothetical protein